MSDRFYKGDVVEVKVAGNYHDRYLIWRPTTEAEKADWRLTPDAKGMTSAGETKLAPRDAYRGDVTGQFTVTRGRANAPYGWGKLKGCTQIQDADGQKWYVRRKDLKHA